MAQPSVLQAWRFCAERDAHTFVYPDGCRDLIVRRRLDAPDRWLATPLDETARIVHVAEGDEYQGWRLHPGVTINEEALRETIAGRSFEGMTDEIVEACCHTPDGAAELLEALRGCRSVATAAKAAGLSVRTLQRATTGLTGRPPRFWMQLARARRAAAAVTHGVPLVEAAGAHGFADQSHMTREFRRWFKVVPGEVRRQHAVASELCAAGY